MSIQVFGREALIGGATDAIDGIDVADSSLANGDIAFCFTSSLIYIFVGDSSSGAAEDSPRIIAPDESGGVAYAGNYRWILVGIISLSDGIGAEESVTISSGAITLNGPGRYVVDTEASASEDDLTTISGLAAGDLVELRCANDSRKVIVKNGSAIKMTSDFTLNNVFDRIQLRCHTVGTVVEVSRANNA